jgi:O-antigen/teichoic acid export membrane protein
VGVIFYLYADQLISFIYGSEMFAAAAPLLRVFAFVIVIRFTVETSALVLTVSRAQEWRMRIVVFLTVFNVVLNLFAIPRYGVTGAAAVSLITSIVAGLLYVFAAHARAFHFGYMFGIRPALAAAMVLCFVAILSAVPVGSMFVGIPLVLLACAAIFYLVGYSGEERAIVFSLPGKWSMPGQVAR